MADKRTALIVGAGIGGLAAGVALQRAGWRVRIFERARHPRELGFALLLAPNAVASLERLGIAQPVIAGGVVVEGGRIHGPGGRPLRTFDGRHLRHRLAFPPVVVLRTVLHGVLFEHVGEDRLSLNSEARGFSIDNGRAILHIADGRDVAGDVVVGADGVASVIRAALHANERPPRASGLWAVRGVAHDVGPPVTEITGAQYFGRGIEGGITPASRNTMYWYLSVPANRLDPARDARTTAKGCAEELGTEFKAIVSATRSEDLRLDELLDRDPIEDWGRGPITLLGDAAHPMLPHAGQGAAQALEDAVALGRALEGTRDVPAALRRYEAIRATRTKRIVLLARRNARVASIANPVGRWLRDAAIRLAPASLFMKAYVEFGKPPPLE